MRRWRIVLMLLSLLPISAANPQRLPDANGNGVPGLAPHLGKTRLKHDNMVIGAAFAPDGKTAATGGWDNLIRVWDVSTGKEIRRISGHQKPIYAVAFTPDGTRLASGSEDRTIRIWDPANGKELRKLEGHLAGVTRVAFTPDGKRLASAGYDQTVRVWDVANGTEVQKWGGQQRGFTSFALSPDGKRLATGAADHSVRLLEIESGKELRLFHGHQTAIVGVAFSPDARWLASGSEDQTVRLWHVAGGRQVRQLTVGTGIWAVAFTPDSRYLAAGGRDKRLRVWETVTGTLLRLTDAHGDGIPALDFSADGRLLLSGSHDTTAALWEWSNGKPADLLARTTLTEDEFNAGWNALAQENGLAAQSAVWQLAATPRQTVPFLRRQLRPVGGVEETQLTQWIADLDNSAFAVRQRATNQLQAAGELAEPALREVLDRNPVPEVRQRVERLLSKLESGGLKPEQLQELRSIEVLERIGSADARQIVESLARGAPGARTTEGAKNTLRRWEKRH
jgi:dipeptidyl aminopeptidase/acylaminoacyl peptidase